MASLGSFLSELRTARGVSLEEMARSTRVSQRYLEALETDDHAELPAPVFTRGFIRAYCQTLEEPCDEALRRYAEQTGEKPVTAHRVDSVRGGVERNSGARSAVFVSLVLLVVLGVALFVLTFVLQGGNPRAPVESKPAPEAKPTAAVETPSQPRPTPSPAVPALPALPAPPPPPAAAAPPAPANRVAAPYRLVARATEKTWVKILTDDGRPVAEEVIPAGERREWQSNRRFVVTVGNAGGIDFELNGQVLPRLGPSGEVVRQLVIPAEDR